MEGDTVRLWKLRHGCSGCDTVITKQNGCWTDGVTSTPSLQNLLASCSDNIYINPQDVDDQVLVSPFWEDYPPAWQLLWDTHPTKRQHISVRELVCVGYKLWSFNGETNLTKPTAVQKAKEWLSLGTDQIPHGILVCNLNLDKTQPDGLKDSVVADHCQCFFLDSTKWNPKLLATNVAIEGSDLAFCAGYLRNSRIAYSRIKGYIHTFNVNILKSTLEGDITLWDVNLEDCHITGFIQGSSWGNVHINRIHLWMDLP